MRYWILRLYNGGGYQYETSPRRIKQAGVCDTVTVVYEHDDARAMWWQMQFDKLDKESQRLILAAFPDILNRDKSRLQLPIKYLRIIANELKERARYMLKLCPDCGGSGRAHYSHYGDIGQEYDQDNDFNYVRCVKCGAVGFIFPKIDVDYLVKVYDIFDGIGGDDEKARNNIDT